MKKSILAVAGLAAVAGIAAPVAGAFATATASQEDTVVVTISDNCTLRNISHAAGVVVSGGTATNWADNKVSGTMTNSSTTDNFGQTTIGVTCNDTAGSKVSVATTNLTGNKPSSGTKNAIAPATDFSASKSGWGLKSSAIADTPWQTTDDVWSTNTPTSTASFTVTYGIGIDSIQQADTYTGTATYTLTHGA